MRYSDWQLNRLRDALRAYHRYGRGADGSYFNWKDVSEAIAESTDVSIPPERLRQFVEGFTAKDGIRRFPLPQEASLAAIVAFATDEENELLSPAELEEHAPPWQAAHRLLEYLDQAFDAERIMPPEGLAGMYRSGRLSEGTLTLNTLTLQRPSNDGLIQAVKTEEVFPDWAAEKIDSWSHRERRAQRKSEVRYGGWAILTPEDNLLIFLKKERNGTNRYYLTIASDLSHTPGSQVRRLMFLHHEYPLELEQGDNDPQTVFDQAVNELRQNVLIFVRQE